MGMFDDVRCLMPLPDYPAGYSREFQTKDFEPSVLAQYEITEAGRLILLNDGFQSDAESKSVDTEYHGMLNFYTVFPEDGNSDKSWWEFNAKFTDGQCVGIERVEDES